MIVLVRMSSVHRDGNILVILEVETHTGKVNQGLYASLSQLLWVTNTRALKDERRAQGATRNNDLLAGANNP